MNSGSKKFDSLGAEKQNPIEHAKNKIMTFKEYAEKEIEPPYIFSVEAGDKKITYFGSLHNNNPDDPMWSDLERLFRESNAEMVFIEGTPALNRDAKKVFKQVEKFETRGALIEAMGESGFILKLASEQGIPCESPEPDLGDEVRFLQKRGFSQEEIFAYYFFRNIPAYHRQAGIEDIKEYVEPYVREFQDATQWENFEYSREHAAKIGEQIWGSPFNLENPAYYVDRVNPVPWKDTGDRQTIVNKIAAESSLFRDQYVVDQTADRLQNFDRIFIVFGETHAVMEEPALRALLENKTT